MSSKDLLNAAIKGNITDCQILMHKKVRFTSRVFIAAVRNGHLELVKWLISVNCPLSKSAGNVAVFNGRKEVFLWLWEHHRKTTMHWNKAKLCNSAANGNQLELLKLLRSTELSDGPIEWDFTASEYAANNGYVEILQWIYDNGGSISDYCDNTARLNNKLNVLQWLESIGKEVDRAWACKSAAACGDLEMLKWAAYDSNGECYLSTEFVNLAIHFHHDEIVDWLGERGINSFNRIITNHRLQVTQEA